MAITKYSGLAAIALSVACGQPSNENIKDASIPAGHAVEEYNPGAGNENMPPELRAMMEERVLNLNAPLCNNQINARFLQQGYQLNCGKYMYIYSHQDRQMMRNRIESLVTGCEASDSNAGTLEALTPENFDGKIKSNRAVILFNAEYCPSCHEMELILEGFCSELNGVVFCGTYDKEQDEEKADKITERYQVFAVPMTRFFCNGEEQERLRLDGAATDKFCMLMEMSEKGRPAQMLRDTLCDSALDYVEAEGDEAEVSEAKTEEYLRIKEGIGAEDVMPYWQEWLNQQ